MRRILLVVTVAVVTVAATMVLAGTAFAQSCFAEYASQPGPPPPPGPGTIVNKPVTTILAPGNVDELAREVGLLNQVRPCPPS